ncbi:MAG: hypothetical protein Kow0020_03480 [Wenzhouxiangellaceae bacterium]
MNSTLLEHGLPLLKLLLAYALALPVAINRERYSRIMGLRTFPLVAMAACAYVLIADALFGGGDPNAMARIIQGILTGIGFIGGGAILKNGDRVRGTATAATIWTLGALGVSVAVGQWALAVALSLVAWLTLSLMVEVKQAMEHEPEREDRLEE